MQDRFRGYVDDVGYTFGVCPELNPHHARLAFLQAGLAPPAIHTACELGFGQGVSLALHAAASEVRWWGTDLLPVHVESARALCAASGADAQVFASTFAEFHTRRDLPDFDFIGLHGVLSWVSAQTRSEIAAFIRDRLAPGGVVFASCNTLPGWSDLAPLRELATQHAMRVVPDGATTVERIEAALEFMQRFLDTNPLYATTNPRVTARFERMRRADRRYLAHEFFNRDWHPLHFSDVASLFAEAGLEYACAAHLRDQLDGLLLTREQQTLLGGIPDPHFRETARDFATNRQFRRDYWVRKRVRTPRPLDDDTRHALWRETRVVLTRHPDDIPAKVVGERGEVRLAEPAHRAVIDALASHRPGTVGSIAESPACRDIALDVLTDAIHALAAFGHVMPAQDDATIARCAPRAAGLNALLLARARTTDDIDFLASPVTGGGVAVDAIDQLLLGAVAEGATTPAAWVARAATAPAFVASRLDMRRLTARADRLAGGRLAMLRELGCVPGDRR
jgi:SAM-dependent methyltransferase